MAVEQPENNPKRPTPGTPERNGAPHPAEQIFSPEALLGNRDALINAVVQAAAGTTRIFANLPDRTPVRQDGKSTESSGGYQHIGDYSHPDPEEGRAWERILTPSQGNGDNAGDRLHIGETVAIVPAVQAIPRGVANFLRGRMEDVRLQVNNPLTQQAENGVRFDYRFDPGSVNGDKAAEGTGKAASGIGRGTNVLEVSTIIPESLANVLQTAITGDPEREIEPDPQIVRDLVGAIVVTRGQVPENVWAHGMPPANRPIQPAWNNLPDTWQVRMVTAESAEPDAELTVQELPPITSVPESRQAAAQVDTDQTDGSRPEGNADGNGSAPQNAEDPTVTADGEPTGKTKADSKGGAENANDSGTAAVDDEREEAENPIAEDLIEAFKKNLIDRAEGTKDDDGDVAEGYDAEVILELTENFQAFLDREPSGKEEDKDHEALVKFLQGVDDALTLGMDTDEIKSSGIAIADMLGLEYDLDQENNTDSIDEMSPEDLLRVLRVYSNFRNSPEYDEVDEHEFDVTMSRLVNSLAQYDDLYQYLMPEANEDEKLVGKEIESRIGRRLNDGTRLIEFPGRTILVEPLEGEQAGQNNVWIVEGRREDAGNILGLTGARVQTFEDPEGNQMVMITREGDAEPFFLTSDGRSNLKFPPQEGPAQQGGLVKAQDNAPAPAEQKGATVSTEKQPQQQPQQSMQDITARIIADQEGEDDYVDYNRVIIAEADPVVTGVGTAWLRTKIVWKHLNRTKERNEEWAGFKQQRKLTVPHNFDYIDANRTIIGASDFSGALLAAPDGARVTLFGPTGSGKSRSIIEPSIIATEGGVLSTSTDPEIYLHTNMDARTKGDVFLFDPFNVTGAHESDRKQWNPLKGGLEWTQAKEIAHDLILGSADTQDKGDDGYWHMQAEAILAPLLLVYSHAKGGNMEQVKRAVKGLAQTGPGTIFEKMQTWLVKREENIDKLVHQAQARSKVPITWDTKCANGMTVRQLFHMRHDINSAFDNLEQFADGMKDGAENVHSTMTFVQNAINPWDIREIQQSTMKNEIDPDEVWGNDDPNNHPSFYLVAPKEKQKLVKGVFVALANAHLRAQGEHTKRREKQNREMEDDAEEIKAQIAATLDRNKARRKAYDKATKGLVGAEREAAGRAALAEWDEEEKALRQKGKEAAKQHPVWRRKKREEARIAAMFPEVIAAQETLDKMTPLPLKEQFLAWDEAANMAPLPNPEQLMSDSRKNRLRILAVFQTQAQIAKIWGQEVMRAIVDNSDGGIVQLWNMKDMEAAKLLSDTAGSTVVYERNVSVSVTNPTTSTSESGSGKDKQKTTSRNPKSKSKTISSQRIDHQVLPVIDVIRMDEYTGLYFYNGYVHPFSMIAADKHPSIRNRWGNKPPLLVRGRKKRPEEEQTLVELVQKYETPPEVEERPTSDTSTTLRTGESVSLDDNTPDLVISASTLRDRVLAKAEAQKAVEAKGKGELPQRAPKK